MELKEKILKKIYNTIKNKKHLLNLNILNKTQNKMTQVKTEIKFITPSIAKEMLNNSTRKNRIINKANVIRYVNEIKAGKWAVNGESIKVDYNGDILDGQHRLLAIINSNIPIQTMVTTGLNPEVFTTLDTGKKRDGSDVLSIIGVQNSRNVAATIKLVKQLDKGFYGDFGSTSRILSNDDFPRIYNDDPEGYQDSIKFASKAYKSFSMAIPTSLIASFDYYLSKRYSKTKARDFLEKLCFGYGMTENSPVLALRNRLLTNKVEGRKEKLLQSDIIKYMIVGFNKYYEGKELKRHLRLPEGEIKFI